MENPQKPDAFGEALEAYALGNKKAAIKVISSIAEDDKIPVQYLFRRFDEMPELEQIALKNCRGKVLDCGAGAGSHALWLQEKGLEVCALDISGKAVETMQKRGVKNAIQSDIYAFKPETKFDTILLLMNGIGLAGNLENLPHFLAHLKTMLTPNGQLLCDSSDILYMFEDEEGAVCLDLNGAYYGEVEYQMAYGKVKSEPFPWLFIDYPLLSEYAKNAGFEAECLFEDEHFQYLAKLSLT